jgi:aspartyl/glutamyl-tRNA(Asn/Gln) amidotransferase C subunit
MEIFLPMSTHQGSDPVAIAHLARLELSSTELGLVQDKFSAILDAFDVVADVEVREQIEAQTPKTKGDLRPDTLGFSLGQEVSLANAPQSYEGHFRVPPVL